MRALRDKCVCPSCGQRVLIKNLRKNASYSSIAAIIRKMQAIIKKKEDSDDGNGSGDNDNDKIFHVVIPKTPVSAIKALNLNSTLTANDSFLRVGAPTTPITPTARKKPSTLTKSAKRQRTKTKISHFNTTSNNGSLVSLSKSIVLLTTGITADEREILKSSYAHLASSSSVKTSLRSTYTRDVTHIITSATNGLAPRTVKYLRGILDGKHIVSFDWYLANLSTGHFVDESNYLIVGDDVVNVKTDAVRRSIIAHQNGDPSLFNGLLFFFAGTFTPPAPSRTDLCSLVSAGGGKVIARKPKADYDSNAKAIIILSSTDSANDELPWTKDFSNRRPWSWLLECISHYRLIQ